MRTTILVVDDEPMVRKPVVHLLRRLGYDVLVAESGEEAIALVANHAGPIDLLLTDIMMPGISGLELAAQLSEHRPGLKVVYSSGGPCDKSPAYAQRMGDAYIAKPYSVRTLAHTVRDVLERG